MKKLVLIFITIILIFSGCNRSEEISTFDTVEANTVMTDTTKDINALVDEENIEENYARKIAKEKLQELDLIDKTEIEIAQKIYHYIIENTYFAQPLGLDIWRYRSESTVLLTYVENRSISPILFGVGSCEDYASAMVIMLEEAGISAKYVAGYTISVNGKYTDHAWLVAKINGNWYHFDPQLEQNVSYSGSNNYRFFMKSDSEMVTDHLWGNNLLAYCGSFATENEIEIIEKEHTPPICTNTFLKPESQLIESAPPLDYQVLLEALEQEKLAYTDLEEITLNTKPPVLIEEYPLVAVDY